MDKREAIFNDNSDYRIYFFARDMVAKLFCVKTYLKDFHPLPPENAPSTIMGLLKSVLTIFPIQI